MVPEHSFSEGEVLYAAGDETSDLIVLLEGRVEGIENRGEPRERVIVAFGPREFLGEMRLLTGQRALLSVVASSDGRMLRIPGPKLRLVMAQGSG